MPEIGSDFSARGAQSATFERIAADGTIAQSVRMVAEETAIALEINGVGYAVLMATAQDLKDLAFGFALSERLADTPQDILDVDEYDTGNGVIVRVTLAESCASRLYDRVRHRTSESSCGLCGIENLEQALRPLPTLAPSAPASTDSVFAALAALREHQHLNQLTGAAHAAAWCGPDGAIRLTREDVGRHNAFDKLTGAMARGDRRWDGGFALLSSRCSFELVEKAVLAGCPTLVTISAPTTLAVRRAAEAGLELLVLARPDSLLRATSV